MNLKFGILQTHVCSPLDSELPKLIRKKGKSDL